MFQVLNNVLILFMLVAYGFKKPLYPFQEKFQFNDFIINKYEYIW